MSETRQQVCIRLWKLIKQPFVLPCAFSHAHECKWKFIDAGLLGCELCGSIHACADLTCRNVIETDDGTVCALSGMYVQVNLFSPSIKTLSFDRYAVITSNYRRNGI
jgi:hypothetical protein